MEKFINFLDIVAWILAILSTLFIIGRLSAFFLYDDLDRLRDRMRGIKAHFPIIKGGIVAVICWAWIIAGYIL